MYNERIYLYKATKNKGLEKDKNGTPIDYKIVAENIDTIKTTKEHNIIDKSMLKYQNKIIQVFQNSPDEYINRDIEGEYNDFINKTHRNEEDVYWWEFEWLKDLST